MRNCTVTLESRSPFSPSRFHETPQLDGEKDDAYAKRTWREHCTADDQGNIVIPGMAFKQALDTAASRIVNMKIKGSGRSTYTKFFVTGVLPESDAPLGINKSDLLKPLELYCHVDGRRGSGKRVMRYYPIIPEWKSKLTFMINADEIEQDVFEKHLVAAGQSIGIGRFRPENGGFNGRFAPTGFVWAKAA